MNTKILGVPIHIGPWSWWRALATGGMGRRASFFSGKGSIRRPFGFYILGFEMGWRNTPPWRKKKEGW